jgi:hypothetical protein
MDPANEPVFFRDRPVFEIYPCPPATAVYVDFCDFDGG